MTATPFHILVDGSPVLIYASRNGSPDKVLRILDRFLDTFWQERDLSSEQEDTPGILVAQLVVRFGFEFSEDDFSNLKVSTEFDSRAQYLYRIEGNHIVEIYVSGDRYRQDPNLGLEGCQSIETHAVP
ncbi:MAG: histidine kinase [Cyanobacteria bacterium J06638_20]